MNPEPKKDCDSTFHLPGKLCPVCGDMVPKRGEPIPDPEREVNKAPKDAGVPLPGFTVGELLPWKGWWFKVVGVTKYDEIVLKVHKPLREPKRVRRIKRHAGRLWNKGDFIASILKSKEHDNGGKKEPS